MAKGRKKKTKGPDDRIRDVAQLWFLVEPLLFSMYCTQELTENSQMGIPFRTGQGRIEYNPALLEGMADAELADRMKTEALRIVLKHPYLRQPYRARPEILYLASNITILDNMGGPKAFCYELMPEELVKSLPKGKTFEEYYGLLNRLLPPQESGGLRVESEGLRGESGGLRVESEGLRVESEGLRVESEGLRVESGEDSRLTTNDSRPGTPPRGYAEGAALWEEDSLMTVDINMLIRAVMAGPSKGWGTMPGDMIEFVKASLVPPINVANVLKGFKKSILSNRRVLTRMRPSRRYGFEQMGSKYGYTTRVLVALDVSGSVDSAMLSRMLGLVNRIFKQGIEAIDVLQFDTELQGPAEPIRKAVHSFKVTGRGGTDFQPAADYYMAHREYDGLIYITDGEAPDPEIPAEYRRLPVTWLITDDDLIPAIRHGWKR